MESKMSDATIAVFIIVAIVFLLGLMGNGPQNHWINPVNRMLQGCLWMMAGLFVLFLIAGYALGLK